LVDGGLFGLGRDADVQAFFPVDFGDTVACGLRSLQRGRTDRAWYPVPPLFDRAGVLGSFWPASCSLAVCENRMRLLKEILLPTEFSPHCVDVARSAAGVARHFNSKITLLHVLAPLNPAWAALCNGAVVDEVRAHLKEEFCSRLSQSVPDELRGLAVECIVCEGDPADIITRYCASEGIGLVMMPTRGSSAFRRFLLGSVTAKVLHDVNCPVWTSSHVTDAHPAVSVIPEVIVCAVDRTSQGDAISRWAADLAWNLRARLIVVHAIRPVEFHPEADDTREWLIEDAHCAIHKVLQGSRMPGAEVRVESGSVPAIVRSVVEGSRADLLIVGRASNSDMLGRLRTHSYTLIRESPCPVISI
jgi:nucleotide-binding universal stress UspA family protein